MNEEGDTTPSLENPIPAVGRVPRKHRCERGLQPGFTESDHRRGDISHEDLERRELPAQGPGVPQEEEVGTLQPRIEEDCKMWRKSGRTVRQA